MHRPLGPDGTVANPLANEPRWQSHSKGFLRLPIREPGVVEMLRGCLSGLPSVCSRELLQTSLALAPHDLTRAYFAVSLQREQPRAALDLLKWLAAETYQKSLVPHILNNMGSVLCDLRSFADARAAYRQSIREEPRLFGALYSVSLSCVLGETDVARSEAVMLSGSPTIDDWLQEVVTILVEWAPRALDPKTLSIAAQVAAQVSESNPELRGLSRAFLP
jgi:hypothetical protein